MTKLRALGRAAGLSAAVSAAFAVGWAGYAAAAWSRYGRRVPHTAGDELLDQFIPNYEVGEAHETRVRAPAALTWQAATEMSFDRSPTMRAIFRGRELLLRGHPPTQSSRPFLDEIRMLGWGRLAEVPERRLAFGAVTRPWEADVRFEGMPPEDFLRFDTPGYAKIAWTIEVEPLDDRSSVFRTATRVVTTDAEARARFRRYWSIFSPGILLIRREMLRLVREDAERRAQTAVLSPR